MISKIDLLFIEMGVYKEWDLGENKEKQIKL